VSNDGVKVGWFRPAGVDLKISGRRIDEQAPPLEVDIPCCYPTQFQATGLFFPTGGCWQVNASTGDRSLTFVVDVDFILIPPTSSPALSLSQNIRLPDGEDATKYGLE